MNDWSPLEDGVLLKGTLTGFVCRPDGVRAPAAGWWSGPTTLFRLGARLVAERPTPASPPLTAC
jgi:hypothetical protein